MNCDREFEDMRSRIDEGRECPSCHARSDKPMFHDGDAFNCPVCRLRFNSWLRQPNGMYRDASMTRRAA
jgi:rubredoxin